MEHYIFSPPAHPIIMSCRKIYTLLFLCISHFANTQSLLTFAGGDVSGGGVNISWSAGELVIQTATDGTAAATQGYQQPVDTEDMDTTVISNITVNVITPNNDGINDRFLIEGAENMPLNRLVIINRWREIVFEQDGYQNNWQGTTQSGLHLPQAAYYYFFYPDKNNKKDKQSGTIHILKE